ncbi:hypothetical protein NP493_57g04014 [Ridgeia piscesae]|uniref:Uncharacterized protein n=1 Tax=Ridgeia piscesae TaxID=27915 RepID=A0AAD9PAV2_RIDPI|nr:hypothetical protein NP493_57g04014 [Ridgeia piscesae]
MLKNLLFNAKVCFLRAEQNSGLSLCDLYLDRVNLLDLLVANDCTYIPSIQQLTKNDYLGRLRDKLIQDERLKLAMDVSTKCGLDPSGVWGAWGLTCIKQGDYAGAREKFGRCLKVRVCSK